MLDKVLHFIDRLNEKIAWLSTFIMIILILIMSYEVFRRYLINDPTLWTFEMSGFLFLIYLMMGGGYTQLKKGHVNMDMVYNLFSVKTRAIIDIVTSAFSLLFVFIMVKETGSLASDAITMGRTSGSLWDPPIYHVISLLPVGCGLLFLQLIAKLLRDIRIATGKSLSEGAETVSGGEEV